MAILREICSKNLTTFTQREPLYSAYIASLTSLETTSIPSRTNLSISFLFTFKKIKSIASWQKSYNGTTFAFFIILAFGMDTLSTQLRFTKRFYFDILNPVFMPYFSFVRHGHKILTNFFGWMGCVYEMDAWMDPLRLAITRTRYHYSSHD